MKNFKTFIKESNLISEKNKPTSPEKWARAKASAKSKFAVYPSAYANAWASKKYKSMGGGWRSESESVTEDGMSGVAKEKNPITHHVVNNKTGDIVGKYTSLKAAHRAADKRDNAYGAIAHRVVRLPIEEDGAVAVAGPTNTVGNGAIAGTGGKGGEPGVSRNRNPVMINIRRRPPKI
jgi:hypothetical protein